MSHGYSGSISQRGHNWDPSNHLAQNHFRLTHQSLVFLSDMTSRIIFCPHLSLDVIIILSGFKGRIGREGDVAMYSLEYIS